MYIAQLPMDQKKAVVDAGQEWSVAKMENAKAEADLNDSTTQLSIAQNDVKTLHIGVDSAITQKKSATNSGDTNKINAAAKDLNIAENLEKAGQARVKYLEAYRNYLKVHHRFTQENMYWQEARLELAKSSLAQRSNIAPQKIKFEWFPSQEQERGKRTASAKQKEEAQKQNAVKARETWLAQQKAADDANGKTTVLPDPMAPPVAPPAPAPAAQAPAPAAAPTAAAPQCPGWVGSRWHCIS